MAISLGVIAAAATLATAQQPAAAATAATVPETMPYAIEDFAYPGAAQIEQEQGIKVKRGDGRLLLVDCAKPWDVMVETRIQDDNNYCFDAVGTSGYLTVEIPSAFGIWTKDVALRAQLTPIGEQTKTIDVPKNAVKPVGEGDGTTGNKPSVLVELRITG